MKKSMWIAACVFFGGVVWAATNSVDPKDIITGSRAFVDAKDLKPGVFRKITAGDLPEPGPAGG